MWFSKKKLPKWMARFIRGVFGQSKGEAVLWITVYCCIYRIAGSGAGLEGMLLYCALRLHSTITPNEEFFF